MPTSPEIPASKSSTTVDSPPTSSSEQITPHYSLHGLTSTTTLTSGPFSIGFGNSLDKEPHAKPHVMSKCEREMVRELRTERNLKIASTLRQKREKMPSIDYNANPFCASRQLADQYQLQNYNRNPRYYNASESSGPTRALFVENRRAPQFVNLKPDIGTVTRFSMPTFQQFYTHSDVALEEQYPVEHQEYNHTTIRSMSFGHRPQVSQKGQTRCDLRVYTILSLLLVCQSSFRSTESSYWPSGKTIQNNPKDKRETQTYRHELCCITASLTG